MDGGTNITVVVQGKTRAWRGLAPSESANDGHRTSGESIF